MHCDHLKGTPNCVIKANYPIPFLKIINYNSNTNAKCTKYQTNFNTKVLTFS